MSRIGRATLAVALGALTTIAIAWWIIWPWQSSNLVMGRTFDDFVIDSRDGLLFVQTAKQTAYSSVVVIATWRAPRGYPVAKADALRRENRLGDLSEVPAFALAPSTTDETEVTTWTAASGWPFIALCGTDLEVTNAAGARPPVVHRTRGLITDRTLPFLSNYRLLPVRPVWPGALLDVILFASLWAAILFLPGLVRRAIRLRRGHCPRCNYDLKATPPGSPCPECGTPRGLPA